MNLRKIAKHSFILNIILIFSFLLFLSCGEESKTEDKTCNPKCESGERCDENLNCIKKQTKCEPNCNTWETCNSDFECILTEGNCNKDSDCKENFTCNLTSHICEEKISCNEAKTPSEFKLPADACGELTACNDSFSCSDNQRCENLFIEGDTNEYTQPCCIEGPRGCKKVGEVCESEFDCESGLCLGREGETLYCTKECTQDNNTCPDHISECKHLYVLFACVEPKE